jgi:two-component system, LytTR family, response regulator
MTFFKKFIYIFVAIQQAKMKKYKSIIVDDDELDRLTVNSYVKRFSPFEIVGVFENPEDALRFVEKEPVDILFLDIDMPNITGLEFRKKVLHIPVCIYITAHPEFALESFEFHTLDFIVKPLGQERFLQAVKRIEEYLEIQQKATLFESIIGGDVIYIKVGHQQTKVKLHDILYLEALKDYTLIVTKNKRHCILSNLGNLLKDKNFQLFVRVHRSFAVQKQYVQKINAHDLLLQYDMTIPIGRSYKDSLNILV